ncbi:hypothetical protein HMPREF0866_00570 [Ruminococcaceae bacterium D16]|nr:hypothetical protein HMPREF0866_00570 [Ruminococcaceae bacterium D16]
MAENKNRWKIQALSTLLTNAHLTGFFTGKIFKGNLKGLCVPGLNCYSCPGAIGSCPIGSLQAVIGSSKFCFSYYVVGIIILFGALLGRVICGFLCPFGWFQELLHKIPTKKFSTKKLYFLTYGKYMILLLFVIVLPMTMVNEVGMGDPWFCKWFCPAGVLEGAIPLSIVNGAIRASLGFLFTWKSCILIGIVILSVFFYRPFCKWFCPLGAFYALFNQVSLYRFHIDRNKCTACGACAKACKMDVEVYKTPNHTECIRCEDCLRTCPYGAISKTIPFSKGVNQHEETT